MAIWSGGERIALYLGLVSRSLPLCFFFVGTYYENRFAFFDIFVKRGSFFFLAIVFLVAYFAWLPALIETARLQPIAHWVFALTLLPPFMTLPWLYQKLGIWLDRAWLGRTFSNIEAVKFFLGGVRSATTEGELVRQAEVWLCAIFQAEASIVLQPDGVLSNAPFPIRQEARIRSQGQTVGTIRLGRRANDTPYFSADLALLSSLADVFTSLLENARMQKKKQEQEQREQELMLHASRSELKALRAQINPHFLFNALNVIAGLIHKDPVRAEETVEQLAEVFRYTLRRSEKESVRLEDELDFVRAYLQIEKARFGERLQVCVDLDPEARSALIPTLMIQTLVENAIKHGIASIRGIGMLQIRAGRCGERLRLQVLDNGPGFELEAAVETPASQSGYGLRNLIERLSGHFGQAARLSVERDAAARTTIVSIEMPFMAGLGS
jgi:two-component sensor histidine kinase